MSTELYRRALTDPGDLADWVIEGPAVMSFPAGRLRLESSVDPAEGRSANFVAWLPIEHEGDLRLSWDFRPLREPGLAMVFWAAQGRGGVPIHDKALPARTGEYEQYHSGAIDAYHLAYFRRRWASERSLHLCTVRKSHGFHLVAQGADPLPAVLDVDRAYRLCLTWVGSSVEFSIDGVTCVTWIDDGSVGGPARTRGAIGLRQMAPLIAEYSHLLVEAI